MYLLPEYISPVQAPLAFPEFGRSASASIVTFKQSGNDVSGILGRRTDFMMGYDDEMVVDGGMSITLMRLALTTHVPHHMFHDC